jgi:hypothetical protein
LLRAGFIEQDVERPGPNGITEKPYRDTTKSGTLDVSDSKAGRKLDAAVLDAFVAEVHEAGGQLESSSRQALTLRRASLDDLTARLLAVLDEFDGRDEPDGEPYAVFLAIHRR